MRNMFRRALAKSALYWTVSLAVCSSGLHTFAQDKQTTDQKAAQAKDSKASAPKLIAKAVEFLRTSQADDGSFSSKTGVGPTALVAASLLSVDFPRKTPGCQVDRLSAEECSARRRHLRPRVTPSELRFLLAVMALSKANKDGKYSEQIKKIEAFLKQQQWDEGEGKKPDDPFYGGAGYGSKARPDLSNTGFLVEALHELGRDGDDEAIQRALLFVTRCQNLESPQNTTPNAGKVNDGGFFYTTANGGESMAGTDENGGLRSYGSMTYSGLKSMIYAGVSKDDPRVKAALSFLEKNYTVDNNPAWAPPVISIICRLCPRP